MGRAGQIYMALGEPGCDSLLRARRRGVVSLVPSLFAAPVSCGAPSSPAERRAALLTSPASGNRGDMRIDRGWGGDGEGRNRTGDTTIFSRVLYRLSYLAADGDGSGRGDRPADHAGPAGCVPRARLAAYRGPGRPRTAGLACCPARAGPPRSIRPMSELIHTCYRIGDIDRSVAFYEALGFEEMGRIPIRDEAINVFMGLPGDGPRLELTYNFGVDSYDLGTGYNHIAITVDDLDATLERLAEKGIEPEKPPYRVREGGSRLCFVRDPDGYRIELIERSG
jgi:lactoylglutathione lyase